VILSANRFYESSKPSESLVANGDDPSHATLEGEEASILEHVHDCTNQDDLIIQALKELHTK